ncbi:hypothetical protein ACXYL9_00280 [Qipengyuania sp. CAU 1752]
MRTILAFGAALSLAVPTPALAQIAPESDAELGAMVETLRDPVVQVQASEMLAAMSQVLLNLKVAPLAEAMAEIAGEPIDDIDPDQTVRDLAPEAEYLPQDIHREVPQAMDRLAGMSGALAAMLPALRDMAAQMETAIEDGADSVR